MRAIITILLVTSAIGTSGIGVLYLLGADYNPIPRAGQETEITDWFAYIPEIERFAAPAPEKRADDSGGASDDNSTSYASYRTFASLWFLAAFLQLTATLMFCLRRQRMVRISIIASLICLVAIQAADVLTTAGGIILCCLCAVLLIMILPIGSSQAA